jgi:hypothetical protein
VVVLVLGLAADAAASWISAATAHAHGTGAAGGEEMTWRCGTHELRRRIGKLLEQIVFWDENIYTPPSIT